MSFAEPILHVDMDAFFVEVERLRRPDLVGRPVVVGGDGVRGVVASASYEARTFGVRSAMASLEAKRRCPGLVFVAPDHDEYGRVSANVFEIFRAFTPMVEGLSVDEAFLDVSGLRHHHPSADAVAEAIRAELRGRLGLPASVGVAGSKFVAKLASNAAKPDGILHVPRGTQLQFLWALPARALWGVGEATMATLTRLGVETVGDIAQLPGRVLERELGSSLGRHLNRLARADDPRPVIPDTDAKSISAEHTYDVDLSTVEEVIAAVAVHGDRVGRRLRRAGLKGRTVGIKVRFSDFVTVTRSVTLSDATDTGAVIGRTARELAVMVFDGRPVRLVGVAVTGLVAVDDPQQLTVDDDPRRRALEEAMDAVADRFGEAGVIRGSRGSRTKTEHRTVQDS